MAKYKYDEQLLVVVKTMQRELRELGLSEYEIKAYIQLVKSKSTSGTELSRKSRVPQGKIYHTLQILKDKGLVTVIDSKPKIFRAINPKIGIKKLLRSRKERLSELDSYLPKTISELQKLSVEQPTTDQLVSVLFGKKNAFGPIWHILKSAHNRIDMMFTFEKVQYETRRILREKQRDGVKIRILATKKVGIKQIREFQGYGLDVRYYPVQEIRLFIADKKASIIMVVNPKDLMDRTNILIESKELSVALSHYFNKIWKKSKKI